MKNFDYVVVGAGVEGSATAYYLSKNKYRTLLLEQFPVLHTRGSSHGCSRITRKAYDVPIYTEMMVEGYKLWEELQKKSGARLFKKTGMVYASQAETQNVQKQSKIMDHYGLDHRRLTGPQVTEEFPIFNFGPEFLVDFDPDAGVLRADKCLRALQDEFVKNGGVIRDTEPVMELIPFTGYSNAPQRITVAYWKGAEPTINLEDSPCLILNEEVSKQHFYGLPSLEYPGHFKFCLHNGPNINPDSRDESATEHDVINSMKVCARKHLPGIQPEPSIIESCIYTWTPDGDFILDRHPKFHNVVIGAGFSGHGFKLAPVVGKILGDLVSGQPASYSRDKFKIDRFEASMKSRL